MALFEEDALAELESRVAQAADVIARLKQERDAARKDAADARAEIAPLRARVAEMEGERESLRTERKAVRTRIEKILGQMDLLSSEG